MCGSSDAVLVVIMNDRRFYLFEILKFGMIDLSNTSNGT
jgi:hypothetical protein